MVFPSLVLFLLATTCAVPASAALDLQIFDYVIVGGGSAGAVLATRLSEIQDRTTILLEQGNDVIDPATGIAKEKLRVPYFNEELRESHNYDAKYRSEPIPSPLSNFLETVYQIPTPRVLGGGSSINGMQWARPRQEDLDNWGLTGWTYNDVLPYFIKSENATLVDGLDPSIHGYEGPVVLTQNPNIDPISAGFRDACIELGYGAGPDQNAPNAYGYTQHQYAVFQGEREGTATAYLSPSVRVRSNLEISVNSKVVKVIMRKPFFPPNADPIAIGVRVLGSGGDVSTILAREAVILSAGTFGTPHLLMLSGIGDCDHLALHGIDCIVSSPFVGKEMQDHYGTAVAHTGATLTEYQDPDNLEAQYLTYQENRTGLFAYGLTDQMVIYGNLADPSNSTTVDFGIAYASRPLVGLPEDWRTAVAFLANPKARGSVTLNSAQPTDVPKIDLGYLNDVGGEDSERLLETIEILRQFWNSTALAPFVLEELVPATIVPDSFLPFVLEQLLFSAYHWCCTTGMGRALDANLLVQGVNRLWVIDASSFPTIPTGSPNSLVIAMAEKGADIIKSLT